MKKFLLVVALLGGSFGVADQAKKLSQMTHAQLVGLLSTKFEKLNSDYTQLMDSYCTPQTGSTRKFFASSAGFFLLGLALNHNKANQQAVFTSYAVAAALGLYGLAKYQWLCKTPDECRSRYAHQCEKLRNKHRQDLEKLNKRIAHALLEIGTTEVLSQVAKNTYREILEKLGQGCRAQLASLSKK